MDTRYSLNLRAARLMRPIVLLLLTLIAGIAVAAPASGGNVARISVDSLGAEANGPSQSPSVSSDGRFVAFHSDATNLIVNDLNQLTDVFVHDRQTGETTRVSIATDGLQGNGRSISPAISADGRFVAFESEAENLVANDNNGESDIFVRDRQTGETTRVSVGEAGAEANGSSVEATISGDGRFVAFTSTADNLIAEDENGQFDVFIHDRQTGQTSRVPVGIDADEPNRWSHRPALSENGRYVAFVALASNLVTGDTNGKPDVFVLDQETGTLQRVSLSSSELQATGPSYSASISADGRFVAFDASAPGIVTGDTNDKIDVFVRDRQAGTTVRVTVNAEGAEADDDSLDPQIAAGGRYVAFWSNADNLVPDDSGKYPDSFVADLLTGRVSRVNVSANGVEANDGSFAPVLSADGALVAYTAFAPNLVPEDKNNTWDIFTLETFTSISGMVTQQVGGLPVAGVTISAGLGLTTVTDSEGKYTLDGLLPGKYTLLAAAPGLAFAPPSREVTLPPVATGQDFLAASALTFSVSGTITEPSNGPGIPGVLVSDGAGRTAVTDAQGEYAFAYVPAGSYTLTPSKAGYAFTPGSRLVAVTNADRPDQDFIGQTTFNVVGQVTMSGSGQPLAGVTVSAGTGYEALTDKDGIYLLAGLEPGTYELTASKDGYDFAPPQREVTVPPDKAGQDFVASPKQKRVHLPVVIR